MDTLNLNDKQQEVVSHRGSPLVCFAAAGTGKTQALTCRIASLIKDDGVPPEKIVALTFTTKAANEMKQRAAHVANISDNRLKYVCTFHSFCLKILRQFSANPIFKKYAHMEQRKTDHFSVLDPRGSFKFMRQVIHDNNHIIKELCVLDRKFDGVKPENNVSNIMCIIEKWRNDGLLPDDVGREIEGAQNLSFKERKKQKLILQMYDKYCVFCGTNGVIDFSNLILFATRLLEEDKVLCLYCRSDLFEHLLADEMQDSNLAQMRLINVLCRSQNDLKLLKDTNTLDVYVPKLVENNLMVVGDDYQAIHEWRGARVQNILEFEDSFDNVKTVIFNKNYRSYEEIINAANNVIRNNKHQKHKSLECNRFLDCCEKKKNDDNDDNDEDDCVLNNADDSSDVIMKGMCRDQYAEAQLVVESIDNHVVEKGGKFSDCVILYRMHALSQPFEERLKSAGIPYVIKGSMSFFERKEVNFALSVLKFLFLQENDDLEKIILNCVKGVGQAKMDVFKNIAHKQTQTLWEVICAYVDTNVVSKGKRELETHTSMKECVSLLKEYIDIVDNDGVESLAHMIKKLLTDLGYIELLQKEEEKKRKNDDVTNDRLENLQTFYAFIKKTEDDLEGTGKKITLSDLIDTIMIDASGGNNDENDEGDENNKVTLMTLHSSKGLEWPFVVIVGCDHGMIPFVKGNIEEERRLFYVGITRARDKLLLTYPIKRLLFNRMSITNKSQFWDEMK